MNENRIKSIHLFLLFFFSFLSGQKLLSNGIWCFCGKKRHAWLSKTKKASNNEGSMSSNWSKAFFLSIYSWIPLISSVTTDFDWISKSTSMIHILHEERLKLFLQFSSVNIYEPIHFYSMQNENFFLMIFRFW